MPTTKPKPSQQIALVPIGDLNPHPDDPRQGDIGAIVTSIALNGWYGAVIASKHDDGTLWTLAGEHRWRALVALQYDGYTSEDGDVIGYDTLNNVPPVGFVPVVQLEGLALGQERNIILADNRANDLASYDDAKLAELLAEIAAQGPLDATLFDGDALDQLLAELAAPPARNVLRGVPDDDAPVVPEVPVTRLGDVWLLGEHRLVCGDSTVRATFTVLMGDVIADLVWTDPPYGVDYVGGYSHQYSPAERRAMGGGTVANDTLTPEAQEVFLTDAFDATVAHCRAGACWFVTAPGGPLFAVFGKVLDALGIWRQTLTWVKNSLVMGRSDYHYRHEPVFYGWKPGAAHTEPPDRTGDTVWEIPRPSRSDDHPTMKPVELVARAVRNHTGGGDAVLDPFAGSGTTFLAAHQEGRRAFGVELSPGYCDVICARFQRATGVVPVLESSGEQIDFAG